MWEGGKVALQPPMILILTALITEPLHLRRVLAEKLYTYFSDTYEILLCDATSSVLSPTIRYAGLLSTYQNIDDVLKSQTTSVRVGRGE